jgi:hypothetical protein
LAARRIDSDSVTVYQDSREDVKRLVRDLKEAGFTDVTLLSETYWIDSHPCRLVGVAECEGMCEDSRRCEVVFTRGFYGCACLPIWK